MQALAQQRHLLTCHVKPTGDSSAAAIAMRLAVSTTVVEPTWTLDGEVRPDAALGCYVLDFGESPASITCQRLRQVVQGLGGTQEFPNWDFPIPHHQVLWTHTGPTSLPLPGIDHSWTLMGLLMAFSPVSGPKELHSP